MGVSSFSSSDGLTTAHVADGCMRAGVEVRVGPAGLAPLTAGMRVAGPAVPCRHAGSVDVFFEAMEAAPRGGVLVVDNGGRRDEACVGDLTALEARGAGLAGMVVWGLHRDTAELRAFAWPVFSLGALPAGPRRLDARAADALAAARLGDVRVTAADALFADDDGVLVVEQARLPAVMEAARAVAATERAQAAKAHAGTSLRAQLRFRDFLAARAREPGLTFREHLRRGGGAIEV